MVHTGDVCISLNHTQTRAFLNASGTRPDQNKVNQWVNDSFSDQGIKFKLIIIAKKKFYSVRLVARLNFGKMVDASNPAALASLLEYDRIACMFDAVIKQVMGDESLPLWRWKVTRLDYTIDVTTPHVKQYISLMHKCLRPRGFQNWYKDNHHRGQKQGSLYLVGKSKHKQNRKLTINFYDKSYEIQANHPDRLDAPENILRLEIQVHAQGLRDIANEYGLKRRNLRAFLDWQIEISLFEKIFKDTGLFGPFLRKSQAKQLIMQSKNQKRVKEHMLRIIDAVSKQHSSISKAKDQLIHDGAMSDFQFMHGLERIQELCCVITISDKAAIQGLTYAEGLPGIDTLFLDTYNQSMYLDLDQAS